MLKLHGVAISNYYNMVKQSLLEKGLPFEEVFQPPGQQADFLRLVELVSRQLYHWDPFADYPGLRAWQARMLGREHSQRVLAEQRQALATFRAA